jgi:hypothetical protein
MVRSILTYGVIAGLIVGIPLFGISVAMHGHPPSTGGMVLGFATMFIAFSTIFLAIKRHRDRTLGGIVRFWPALGMGLGIAFVASMFYIAAWELALAVTGIDFAGDYARAIIAEKTAAGLQGAEHGDFPCRLAGFAGVGRTAAHQPHIASARLIGPAQSDGLTDAGRGPTKAP